MSDLLVRGYRFPRHIGDIRMKLDEIDKGGRVSKPRFAFFGGEILTEAAIRDRMQLLIRKGKLKPKVKVYAIQETEMEHLSIMNSQATAYFSAAAGIASFAIAIVIDVIRDANAGGNVNDFDWVLLFYFMPVMIIAALFCWRMGRRLVKSRRSLLDTIKEESKWQSENT